MKRHWLGIILSFVIATAAFGIALAAGYPFVAYGALVVGLVTTVILGVAWMRPAGSPTERHPAIDRVFNDLDP